MPTVKEGRKWSIVGNVRGWNAVYKDATIRYLNSFDPLFEKAKDISEFEFINTLIRVRGLQDAGWDPWENTVKAFDCLTKLEKRIKDFETIRHLFLWLYGHIVEASEPYEIIANLMNIIEGKRFIIRNFPDKQMGKYSKPQTPSEKIEHLTNMAYKIKMPDSIFPFTDVFDRELRNAIFHSDYSLHGGEVRLSRGYGKIYTHEEIQSLINKGLAYFEAFKNLMTLHIRSYQVPKVISVHPEFSKDSDEKAITIIRTGYGLVGLKDNLTPEELKKGKIPFRTGRFFRYETKMLDKDPALTVLPLNRIEKFNRMLKLLPKFIRRRIVKIAEKQKWF